MRGVEVEIISLDHNLSGREMELYREYKKRLKFRVSERKISMSRAERFIRESRKEVYFIALDGERGKNISSQGIHNRLRSCREELGRNKIGIFIGGVKGLGIVVELVDEVWNFGRVTWPHRLVHVMLIEQLFRFQCICDSHPYHDDG